MSTGDLGRRQSDQQIGDITFSYNKTNAAGNALLETNGAMLDAKKYPLLAAKLGTKLEPEPLRQLHSWAHFGMTQSDDGEYCFYSGKGGLWRYKKSAAAHSVVFSWQDRLGLCSCSANGQYVLALYAVSSGSSNRYICHSNDYGESFEVINIPTDGMLSITNYTFVSRDGRHMMVVLHHGSIQKNLIYISHDFGSTWSNHLSDSGGERTSCVEDLSTIYKLIGRNLYESADYGKTFALSTMNLPKSIDRLVIDPLNNDVIVASFSGISELMLSTDGGAAWRRIVDPRLLNTWNVQIYNSVITIIFQDDSGRYHLMISHDFGATWNQSEILSHLSAIMEARVLKGATSYFVISNGLYSSKIEEITRLPLGNLNSERIIADKVV